MDSRKYADCRFYIETSCAKGIACPFRHDEAKRLQYTIEIKKQQLEAQKKQLQAHKLQMAFTNSMAPKDCIYWAQGRCIKGANCPFKHDPAKVQPVVVNAALPSSGVVQPFVPRPNAPAFVPQAVKEAAAVADAKPENAREATPPDVHRNGNDRRDRKRSRPEQQSTQAASMAPEPAAPSRPKPAEVRQGSPDGGPRRSVFDRLQPAGQGGAAPNARTASGAAVDNGAADSLAAPSTLEQAPSPKRARPNRLAGISGLNRILASSLISAVTSTTAPARATAENPAERERHRDVRRPQDRQAESGRQRDTTRPQDRRADVAVAPQRMRGHGAHPGDNDGSGVRRVSGAAARSERGGDFGRQRQHPTAEQADTAAQQAAPKARAGGKRAVSPSKLDMNSQQSMRLQKAPRSPAGASVPNSATRTSKAGSTAAAETKIEQKPTSLRDMKPLSGGKRSELAAPLSIATSAVGALAEDEAPKPVTFKAPKSRAELRKAREAKQDTGPTAAPPTSPSAALAALPQRRAAGVATATKPPKSTSAARPPATQSKAASRQATGADATVTSAQPPKAIASVRSEGAVANGEVIEGAQDVHEMRLEDLPPADDDEEEQEGEVELLDADELMLGTGDGEVDMGEEEIEFEDPDFL